jgi:hypothetical protein
MTKPERAEMTKPEACASCGSLDLASPEAGWVTGKPLSFRRPRRHGDREMYLCSSCLAVELEARQRDKTKLRSMELFSR